MKKALLVVGIAFILCSLAFSQPFGIKFGMSMEELKTVATIIKEVEDGFFIINPQKKSNYFKEYAVSITQKYGVIAITALGNEIENDEYGITIKSEAEKVVKQLTDVYGKPYLVLDELKEGSIWTEPRDWLTSVRKKERDYVYYWVPDLKNEIDLIALGIGFKNTYSNVCFLDFECFSLDYNKAISERLLQKSLSFRC